MMQHCKTAFLLAFFAFFVANAYIGHALPTRHDRFTVEQPDGSKVTVLFKGDEFFKVTTTMDGAAVTMGEDGYLRYVIYENGSRRATDYLVGDKNVPASVISASRNIPMAQLQQAALDKRREYGKIRAAHNQNRNLVTKTGGNGTIKAVAILVEFSDLKFSQGTIERFDNLLNQEGYSDNGATGSARDYFKAQYGDLADFHFDIYGTFSAPNGYAYYGGNDYSGSDAHPDELVAEACKALDDQIDFSQYDMDGDGTCDFVFMFFAGNDEADNSMLYEDNIWSHAWVIDNYDRNLVLDGVRISEYACTSELRTNPSGYGSSFTAIGSFCHEFSHILGLMDAYDTSYNYDGYQIADALWGVTSIMDSGCYNNNCNTPPYYNAFEREMLGIATPVELTTGEMTLLPINESNQFLRIETDKEDEYFIAEYRKQSGWDEYLPTSGMIVYHIDKSDNNAGPSYYYGMNVTAAQRWVYNEVNSYPLHQCADLIEAGNSTSTNNVADVFFPGAKNATRLSTETHDDYVTWSGKEVGYQLYDIKSSGNDATFQLLTADALDLPKVTEHKITVAGTNVMLSWTTDKEDPDARVQVELALRDGTTIDHRDTTGNSLEFMDLETGMEYTVTIWYTKDGNEGEKYPIDFTTFEQKSDFPYIFINRAELVKGNTIKLMLINLESSDCRVEWYLGDYVITTPDNFVLAFDGEKQLKAIITYPDGRKECVMALLTLSPAPGGQEE